MDNKDIQSKKDKMEYENTIRVQKAGNGFIVKRFGPPMIFATWKETSDFCEKYFKSIES